jgi:cell division protein ZapA
LAKVDISINGRLYAVACDEGQEGRVRELAQMMDSRVKQLTGPGPVGGVGETQILVLAGLMLADELSETKAAMSGKGPAPHSAAQAAPQPAPQLSEEDEELLIAAVDHLTERVAVIADRLQQA